jgi:hypothetical protein
LLSREQFDMNDVTVAGVFQKLWGRGGDVFARLRVSHRGLLVEPVDVHACFVTMRFPEGSVGGKPVTLQPNATIRVNGFLTHTQIDESIREFLELAGEPGFLDDVPSEDLDAWRNIGFRRRSAVLNVLNLSILNTEGQVLEVAGQLDGMSLDILNQAVLEGVIVQTWEYQRNGGVDRFSRLAVYDCHTRTEDREGNFGRPRRKPHYITVYSKDDCDKFSIHCRGTATRILSFCKSSSAALRSALATGHCFPGFVLAKICAWTAQSVKPVQPRA